MSEHLLEALAGAGVERGLMVLRPGKEDIPAFFRALPEPPLELDFPLVPPTPSVAHTLDAVHDQLAGRRVVLGYPDILISPRSAWAAVRARQERSGADLVLGLFPTRHPERADMVELDAQGRPRRLWIKQPDRGLTYTWSIALWTPAFTELLHAEVARWDASTDPGHPELQVGQIIQTALDRGFRVEAVAFPDGDSFDIGEPAALEQAKKGGHNT